MKSIELFDKEKVHYNLAHVKRDGETFELIVNPDNALSYKNGTSKNVKDALMYEKIFSDAKKGNLSSEESLRRSFGTEDPLKVAGVILTEGEVHSTAEHREKVRETRRRQIIDLIHRNSIDPGTGLPHTVKRLENAFEKAGIRIDGAKMTKAQIDGVLKKLRVIIPIRFEKRKIQIVVPSNYAPKAYHLLKSAGSLNKSKWYSDGTLFAVLEIPAGAQGDLVDRLNRITHGNVDVKNVGE